MPFTGRGTGAADRRRYWHMKRQQVHNSRRLSGCFFQFGKSVLLSVWQFIWDLSNDSLDWIFKWHSVIYPLLESYLLAYARNDIWIRERIYCRFFTDRSTKLDRIAGGKWIHADIIVFTLAISSHCYGNEFRY